MSKESFAAGSLTRTIAIAVFNAMPLFICAIRDRDAAAAVQLVLYVVLFVVDTQKPALPDPDHTD